MPKKIPFKYGKTIFTAQLPDHAVSLNIQEPVFQVNTDKFMEALLLALPETLSADKTISIVVADKTRLCDYPTYLPVVINVLKENSIKDRQIQFFIAYGTHARQSDEECLNAYGDVYKNYRFIHHDSDDKLLFIRVGTTDSGTQVHLRKDLLESDLILTFGAVSHHYFAGYGGGRKLLFPGLGYTPDIYQNHRLFLDTESKKLNINCYPGHLEQNPLARDLKQIDDFIQPERIAIHGILNSSGKVCRLMVGKTYDDFLRACSTLDSYYKIQESQLYDLVLASCGGFPKDINFIQAHKAIHNASMFVKNNGCLIMLAACSDGIGSDTFVKYFNYHTFDQAFHALEKDYKGNGGTALSLMTKTKRINIFLKTALDDNICSRLGVEKIKDSRIHERIKDDQLNTAWIENASLLIK